MPELKSAWTDAEKVALLFSIIDSHGMKKIDSNKVDRQGRTIKACTHVIAKLRHDCSKTSPARANGDDHETVPAPSKAGKTKTSKKRPLTPADSNEEDDDVEKKESPPKKQKTTHILVPVKEEPKEKDFLMGTNDHIVP